MDWVRLYTSAILEREPEKFMEKAVIAKDAIHAQLRRSVECDDSAKEVLQEALHNLNVLTNEIEIGAAATR